MHIVYYIYIGGSPADLSISYRDSIYLKYILQVVYCIIKMAGMAIIEEHLGV